MTTKTTFVIDGVDRLGKSTLIQGIKDKLGYFEVVHYKKPEKLQRYMHDGIFNAELYEIHSYHTMMRILSSKAHIICDRSHLGTYVYAPMYRKYDGSFIFGIERSHDAKNMDHVRLILLTEDFNASKHFIDDGLSLGPADARRKEQELFIEAFNKSSFTDKRIICVTDKSTGAFRGKEDILAEVLA